MSTVTSSPRPCYYQIVPVMRSGQFVVTLPDIGEYRRAFAAEDEIVLSVPPDKMVKLVDGVREFEKGEFSYGSADIYMLHDFPQPGFYRSCLSGGGFVSGL